MERIDAHCHFWSPARGDYDWLDAAPLEFEPLRRDFTPADLAQVNNNGQVIAVQAAETVAETQYLLLLADENSQIIGVVGWVDLSNPKAVIDLANLSLNLKLKAIRPMLQDIAEDNWINSHIQPVCLTAMISSNLRFEALVQTRHLKHLLRFAEHWPELPIIIDHAAKPVMAEGQAFTPEWQQAMRALSTKDRIYCKVSGLMTELPKPMRNPSDARRILKPLVKELLAMFGAKRLVWGSDWPVLTLAASYSQWQELTLDLLADVTASERADILGRNAVRFYGLGGKDV